MGRLWLDAWPHQDVPQPSEPAGDDVDGPRIPGLVDEHN